MVVTDIWVMTIPFLLPTDVLIRKYRIDDLLTEPNRQFFFKEGDDRKWPSDSSFTFPNKWQEDRDNSISLYVENLLERVNISTELLLETISRPRFDEQDVQYAAFKVPLSAIEDVKDVVKVVYNFDAKDPIAQRGLCHVLISFADESPELFKKQRKAWSLIRNTILSDLDNDDFIETDGFRLS